MPGVSVELISVRHSLPEVVKECHRSISLCCISLMMTLMCSIPHLMASVDSSKASFSAQQEHVEESGGGCGESQEEVGGRS
jgi:hypothetical protein